MSGVEPTTSRAQKPSPTKAGLRWCRYKERVGAEWQKHKTESVFIFLRHLFLIFLWLW